MAPRTAGPCLTLAAGLALAAMPFVQSANAQQPHLEKLRSLSSLLAEGFEVRAASSTQSGIVGTLVLQKEAQVYLCSSRELTIQPTTFECWLLK